MEYKNLDPKLQNKLIELEQKKPEWQTVSALKDIAKTSKDSVETINAGNAETVSKLAQVASSLEKANTQLQKLNDKEAPEVKDYGAPVVAAIEELGKKFERIEMQPKINVAVPKIDVPKIPAPEVTVNVPAIDTTPIANSLNKSLSKSFKEAIDSIPVIEMPDNTELINQFERMNDKLQDIDTGVRMKPEPGVIKVTNADGTSITTNITTSSTTTSVANSVTSVQLLAANPNRKAASIYNDDSSANLYVKFGTTASATDYKIKIQPGGYFEFPSTIYTGRVDGIASAATGTARIAEES